MFRLLVEGLIYSFFTFNPLSANPTKWSNTLKQFVGNLPTNCLSVFNHFVKSALKGLRVINRVKCLYKKKKSPKKGKD